jgi:HK97 gp10 family phage protein
MARARLRVRVEGNEDLRRTLQAFPETLRKGALTRGVQDAADEILGAAEHNVPRRTGALLLSLQAKPIRSRRPHRIGVNVQNTKETFYAAFLEYGTSRMAAQPWLRPALLSAGPRAIQRALQAVKTAMATAGYLR